ncbi:RnfABCDGE type electron transport complex subunit D [Ktedonobacter robiniae]|uniref:Uncharacterized protein n=1 Tax=Ktedonobacter robiniae TaxID=2778365 RepID=A0ABQ3V5G4_9CHLR|nr:RnfABCDGE type electron transport complex subunit D [Ktedonobacter robiniae]GHO60002.1 hypothetical protein KSB_84770 [Ktedonobacter robiniae]
MEWSVYGTKIIAPKISDPRLFMILVLITYTIIGHVILAFDRNIGQILASVLVACVLDVGQNYLKTRSIILPVSGVITGMGLGILISSTMLWPFIVAPILAIASKGLIQVKGHHIFNPSNFGLTALLILAPTTVSTLASQWSGSLVVFIVVLALGSFTSFRAARWDLSLTFLLGFCVMGLLDLLIRQSSFAIVYGPLLGSAFQLFVLSMITDPKTTPATRRMRIVFGLTLAVLDRILRLMDNQNSVFIALLIVAACVPLCQTLEYFIKQSWTSRVAVPEVEVVPTQERGLNTALTQKQEAN